MGCARKLAFELVREANPHVFLLPEDGACVASRITSVRAPVIAPAAGALIERQETIGDAGETFVEKALYRVSAGRVIRMSGKGALPVIRGEIEGIRLPGWRGSPARL